MVSKTGNDLISFLGNALLRPREKSLNEPEDRKEEFIVSDFVVFFSFFFILSILQVCILKKIVAEVMVSILGQTDHWN